MAWGVALDMGAPYNSHASHDRNGGAGRRKLGARYAGARREPSRSSVRLPLGISRSRDWPFRERRYRRHAIHEERDEVGNGDAVFRKDGFHRCERRDLDAIAITRPPQRGR